MTYIADIREALRVSCGSDLDRMLGNMSRLGPTADRIADIPEGLFDGVDVQSLNCLYMPTEYGGQQLLQSGVARCVLSEMFGYADPALAIAFPGPGLILAPIFQLGSEEQKQEFLGRFQSAEPAWGGFAITEPRGGSDATHLTTTAKPSRGGYVLNGEKCLIGNGGRASFFIVYAATDPARGQFGIQPFLVDADTPGLRIDDSAPMLGLRPVRVAQLCFRDCWIPAECHLGDQGASAGAFLSAQRTWEYMRPALSALIIGALSRLLDDLEILGEENHAPLRENAKALAKRIRPRIGSVRLLSHHAAGLLDAGRESAPVSSMAKSVASTLASNTVSEAILAVNAAGVQASGIARDIERWARDFQAFEVLEGTKEVHQLMVVRAWRVRARRSGRGAAAVK